MATASETAKSPLGVPQKRVDGPLKVSGTAKYTSDHNFAGMLYAIPVCSTVGNGKIEKIDTAAAERLPGVRAIFHRQNIGRIYRVARANNFSGHIDEERPPLEDDVIRYFGQYVALAVADTFDEARAAAEAVKVTYSHDAPNVDPQLAVDGKPNVESERGDAGKAFEAASIKLDQTYVTPVETHNAIELHATVAVWDGKSFTLYETTQAIVNHQQVMTQMLGVPKESVRVISRFLGSGFGSKLWPWPHCALAAAAARHLRKPVKLVLTRQMNFYSAGHRPRTQQRLRLSATPEGKLTSLQHDFVSHVSLQDEYKENCGEATPFLYSVPNLRVTQGLARRHVGTPTSMRGPGAVPGLFALESAMDELAIQLKIDPVQFRLLNEPEIDEGIKLPFSSRHLKECLSVGGEKFGWSKRNPQVGSMKRDGLTLGWGMAACTWIAERVACEATVELRDDGTARVSCATQDIGTGTYTVLAQIVADKLGLPVEKVEVVLGDSALPPGALSGGSMATASVIPPVLQATDDAIDKLLRIASRVPGSELSGRKPEELAFDGGHVVLKGKTSDRGIAFDALLRSGNLHTAFGTGKSEATFGGKPKVSSHSFGCHFVEVTWQPELARLRVSRVVTVIDAGRIINPLAGRNQIEGAVVMGIGMALFEHTIYDARNGQPINNNLADYIVATHADVPPLEVHFVEYPDLQLNALGARGIGEIGLAGVAAAIASAVHHATGVRVRELPIKIENLLV